VRHDADVADLGEVRQDVECHVSSLISKIVGVQCSAGVTGE
jgi:hypothetical protein